MFERFTDRARLVVVHAQAEARSLGHGHIGPEHLLLGLAREGGGLAAKALTALGISLEAVRERVVQGAGCGDRDAVTSGHIPFSPAAKDTLAQSLRESQILGHRYIGTEHILLALLSQDEERAARVLADLGASADTVRAQLTRLLDEYTRRADPPAT